MIPTGMNIVISDASWTVAGDVSVADSGWVTVSGAHLVKQWGARGLGHLAKHGPSKDTQLEPLGEVVLHSAAVALMIPCKTDWTECP